MADEDDLNLPRAAINKLIKETLPQVRVSNEARELIVTCCNEFIHLVSSEANEICNKNTKKTIMPEHVLNDVHGGSSPMTQNTSWSTTTSNSSAGSTLRQDQASDWTNQHVAEFAEQRTPVCRKLTGLFNLLKNALENLGFSSYVDECREVLEECKHVALKKRRGSSRLENLGIPEEELLRQQQELFAQARQQQLEQEQQEWFQKQMELAAGSARLAQSDNALPNDGGGDG